MATEVIATDEFVEWYEALSDADSEAVYVVVSLLEELGPALPFPYSSAISGSSHALRELRIQRGGRPLRVLYIFDKRRQAVLLIGGDKTGDDRFYGWAVPKADRIWEQYLREQEEA